MSCINMHESLFDSHFIIVYDELTRNMSIFLKVKLSRDFIKLSPISSAIIPHKTPDGHVSKLGYVKLSAFSQVIVALTHLLAMDRCNSFSFLQL